MSCGRSSNRGICSYLRPFPLQIISALALSAPLSPYPFSHSGSKYGSGATEGQLLRHTHDKFFLVGISGGKVTVVTFAGLAKTDDVLHIRRSFYSWHQVSRKLVASWSQNCNNLILKIPPSRTCFPFAVDVSLFTQFPHQHLNLIAAMPRQNLL